MKVKFTLVLSILSGAAWVGAQSSTPKYQRFPYFWPHCPDGFDITTQEECSKAIATLGITSTDSWTGKRNTMPRFCSLQKDTDDTIFNTDPTGVQRRFDLAPVCKWTGGDAPPDFFRVSREDVTDWRGEEHTITVKPEEWEYFLAFQEDRKNGFSCPCNRSLGCNEIKAPGQHWHPPNPEKATFDCTLWIAAWLHAEDQCIQGYFSHISKDGFSPRLRCEAVGAVETGEHQAGRHTTGPGALGGLQTSPGHCNSMFNPTFLGFAVAHGARRNDPRGNGDVWTVLYNGGGSSISDSESCIPAGYTATGERKNSSDSPTPAPGQPSKYQLLDYGEAACAQGLEIESESECDKAIAALGIISDGSGTWDRTTMPKGCSLQKGTNERIFNTGKGGQGRHDLAPVCKVTRTPDPETPEPTSSLSLAPTNSPTQHGCLGLSKTKCNKKKEECVFSLKRTMGKQCETKQVEFENDCSQTNFKNVCMAKSWCKYTNDSGCLHICINKTKKNMCNEVPGKICKWTKKLNPCFKCQPVSKCAS